ncbi:MAG: acetyl-CoA acetyltransferase [SAR202 cluster bacterium MP-SAtl-SRR3965592-G2]|nr:MAG: acetyl-CoA acetyltransferase [SAR202 cluster bacterium MP-SAtl-SRR3965592-G2]PKB77967.1 MAG: acetyl-CoA acetyltransferase [SAR202 cluster bacterium MP-SInd-SRR3963457-G2]HIM78773.1 acetyl-CoA acetyltransferase [Dehalococcoidia bacterium]
MSGIKDQVAIIGMGCSKFGERWDVDSADLMVEAAYEAFADAGIESKDVQAAWLGTVSSFRTGQPLAAALKLDYIPISRLENACATATDAFRNACYAVAAGIYDIVLVMGVEKLKDSGFSGLAIAEAPGSDVAPPAPPPAQFAMAATRYFHHYDIPYDEGRQTLAEIAVKNHHNGTMSPKAHFQREVSVEQVINAPMIAWPLGLYDCCGVSDGAAAAIITTPEIARSFRDDYVLVKGLGLAVGAFGMLRNDWDFVHFPESVRASQACYQEAGITDPRKELDLAMVHDCFTITELIIYEDLGFSPRGKASEDVAAGTFSLEGELPVNTDGGLKCFGHPIGASGIRMIYEVYKQIQGKAGARQLAKADLGITHNLGGRPGSFTCSVAAFGARD